MQLTEEEQQNIMSISEEEVAEVDEIQPQPQPFVIPQNFQTFFGDFQANTCQYR